MKLDNRGSSSFAFIAVLLFLSMVLVHAYMGRLDVERSRAREEAVRAMEARDAALEAIIDIRAQASFSALSASALSRHIGVSTEELFAGEMDRYIAETFPRQRGDVRIAVLNASWNMGVKRMGLRDLVPVVDETTMMVEGSWESRPDAVRSSTGGETEAVVSPSAHVSISLMAQSRATEIVYNEDIDISVEQMHPFLDSRAEIFDTGLQGSLSGSGRTVQYILTSLAQYRVFQGMAAPGTQQASALLSERDVEMAVNLAVYMEQLRAFRAIDPRSLNQFDERNMPLVQSDAEALVDMGVIRGVGERSMTSLLSRYMREGSVDGADLMALFMCLDREHIAVDVIIAQSLYTILDQLVLKYMDYFSLPSSGYLEGTGFSIQQATNFAGAMLTDMGSPRHIMVQPEPFDTGETATSFANMTMMHSEQMLLSLEANDTWQRDVQLHDRGYLWEEPNLEHLGLGDRVFVVRGQSHVNLDLEVVLEYTNSTYNIKLEKRNASSWDGWESLGEWTGGGANGTSVIQHYSIMDIQMGGLDFRVTVDLEDHDSSSNVHLSQGMLQAVEHYPGAWINRTNVVLYPNGYYNSLSYRVGQEQQRNADLSFIWSYIRNLLHEFLSTLIRDISQYICELLFPGGAPRISINPHDSTSITESMRLSAKLWTSTGTNMLLSTLKNRERLEDIASRIIDTIIRNMFGSLQGVLENLLGGVGNFLNTAKNMLVNRIYSALISLGGAAATVVEIITFGFVSADNLRNTASIIVERAHEYWQAFEERIRGAVQTMLDSVNAFIEGCMEAMARVVAGVIHRLGRIVDGFVREAITVVGALVDYMMRGGAVSSVEYREHFMVAGEDISIGEFEFIDNSGTSSTHGVKVVQNPAYISQDTGFDIYLDAPTGLHYTAPFSISQHPYETVWELSVAGPLSIQVLGAAGLPHVGLGDPSYMLTDTELNISLSITVFSGWPLEGVCYEASRTFMEDLANLFNMGWDKLLPVFEGMVHFITKAADLFSRLMQELMTRADYVVEAIDRIFQKTMDLMARLLTNTGYRLASQLMSILSGGGAVLGPISVFGYEFKSSEDRNTGILNISLRRENSFDLWVLAGQEDSFLHMDIFAGNMQASVEISSVVDRVYDGIVCGGHTGGWVFQFHGPENRSYSEAKLSIESLLGKSLLVPTPLGPAFLDLGFVLRTDVERINASLEEQMGTLGTLMLAGPGALVGEDGNLSMGTAVDLAQAITSFIVSDGPLERMASVLDEASESTTVEIFLEIRFGMEEGGATFRIGLVLNDPLSTILEAASWMVDNIQHVARASMEGRGFGSTDVVRRTPPGVSHAVTENISLSISLGGSSDLLGRDTFLNLEANLPAIGALAGREWGSWMVDVDLTTTRLKSRGEHMDDYESDSSFVGTLTART